MAGQGTTRTLHRLSKSSSSSSSPLIHSQAPLHRQATMPDSDAFRSSMSSLDVPSSILSTPLTKLTTLPSGLRVATESYLALQTATVGVWIAAGSRFESGPTSGTAHFLEHMLFKGTNRRSVWRLEEDFETVGGHLNAYTSREQTFYYAKVMKKHVPFALDVLADILQNPLFDRRRIDIERDVILREMQEVESNLQEVVFDHLHAAAFQHSPLARTILGPVENIKSITRANLKDYISMHYSYPRMVIAAAGAVYHDQIVKFVRKLFTKLSTNKTTVSELIKKEPTIFKGSEVRMRDDDLPLAHFAIAVKGAEWTDPDSTALMVMQSMLGSWNKDVLSGKFMGSKLAQKVSPHDLVESIMAFNTNYTDGGLFGVYAVAKSDALHDLSIAIMNALFEVTCKVSEEDIKRAKTQLKACYLLHLDGTTQIVEDMGRQLLAYGRRVPFAEFFARIDAVDVETIKRVGTRFLFDKDIAIASLGPVETLPNYKWFRNHTRWQL